MNGGRVQEEVTTSRMKGQCRNLDKIGELVYVEVAYEQVLS